MKAESRIPAVGVEEKYQLVPAFDCVDAVLTSVHEPLQMLDDTEILEQYIQRLNRRGTCSELHRCVFRNFDGHLKDVFTDFVERTLREKQRAEVASCTT